MATLRTGVGGIVLVVGGCIAWISNVAQAAQESPVGEPAGAQVLTQGPIHEAFAEPLIYDPKPSPVVSKAPPPPINEVPPDQKPEGANVQWIPGYWGWDDSRSDYIWVSGVWRAIPPGRQWVPGYWQKADDGYHWVQGYWASTETAQVQYLPEPPASVDNGPNTPPPSGDAVWDPGNWVWQSDQYAWQPGYWVQNQPGWMWTPASYSWTPNGYIYNQGFWDYPLMNRGLAFAPVYFSQPVYGQPNFLYSPSAALLSSALLSSLFVRPAYGSYYFGDYYAPSNFQSGIYPWYAFHGSRYGYDPLYAYAAAQNLRTNPRWADELHQVYNYRRAHPEARPPRTFAETRALAARPAPGASLPAGAANLALARPLSQLASPTQSAGATAANAIRLERLDQARRQELSRQAAQLHQFREDRSKRELEARRPPSQTERPAARSVEVSRSPIVAAPRAEGRIAAPPSMPREPAVERSIRPPAPGAAVPAIRHEPQVQTQPPVPHPSAPGAPAPKRR
jgi:hypothetical protein